MSYIIVVMKITLSPEKKQELEILHSQEKNRRKADRVKSVLLRDEGWPLTKIAQALRIHADTVSRYIADYLEHESLDFKYQGSHEQLSEKQSSELVE
jgi:predicted transcriptional regulator